METKRDRGRGRGKRGRGKRGRNRRGEIGGTIGRMVIKRNKTRGGEMECLGRRTLALYVFILLIFFLLVI